MLIYSLFRVLCYKCQIKCRMLGEGLLEFKLLVSVTKQLSLREKTCLEVIREK